MKELQLIDVAKSFRGRTLYRDVNLTLDTGRCYGLAGPNGVGKSVLLRIACGFTRPDSGRVEINPDYLAGGRTFPDRFGVLIDGPSYLAGISGRRNLQQLAAIRGRIGPREIDATMESLGLDPDNRDRVARYSAGMKQKLGLAQALMEEPRVLLLDEPFTALDQASSASLTRILRERLEQGVTILFTSHHAEEMSELAEKVFTIDDETLR